MATDWYGYEQRFLPPAAVAAEMALALAQHQPWSLIRIGDGEARVLAHDILVPSAAMDPLMNRYRGCPLPDEQARQDLIAAMRAADIVGLSPDRRHPECAPLTEQILTRLGLEPLRICSAGIAWDLVQDGRLFDLLRGRRTVVVGRRAAAAVPALEQRGASVAGTVGLEGLGGTGAAFRSLGALHSAPGFDLILFAAGVPGKILAPRAARAFQAVCFDLGHALLHIMDPGFGSLESLQQEKRRWQAEQGL